MSHHKNQANRLLIIILTQLDEQQKCLGPVKCIKVTDILLNFTVFFF